MLEDKYQLIMGVQILNALMTQMAIYYKYLLEKPEPDYEFKISDGTEVKVFDERGHDIGYMSLADAKVKADRADEAWREKHNLASEDQGLDLVMKYKQSKKNKAPVV